MILRLTMPDSQISSSMGRVPPEEPSPLQKAAYRKWEEVKTALDPLATKASQLGHSAVELLPNRAIRRIQRDVAREFKWEVQRPIQYAWSDLKEFKFGRFAGQQLSRLNELWASSLEGVKKGWEITKETVVNAFASLPSLSHPADKETSKGINPAETTNPTFEQPFEAPRKVTRFTSAPISPPVRRDRSPSEAPPPPPSRRETEVPVVSPRRPPDKSLPPLPPRSLAASEASAQLPAGGSQQPAPLSPERKLFQTVLSQRLARSTTGGEQSIQTHGHTVVPTLGQTTSGRIMSVPTLASTKPLSEEKVIEKGNRAVEALKKLMKERDDIEAKKSAKMGRLEKAVTDAGQALEQLTNSPEDSTRLSYAKDLKTKQDALEKFTKTAAVAYDRALGGLTQAINRLLVSDSVRQILEKPAEEISESRRPAFEEARANLQALQKLPQLERLMAIKKPLPQCEKSMMTLNLSSMSR